MVLKAQVKRVTLKSGDEAFVVCGIALPCKYLDSVGKSNELWIMKLHVIESISYSEHKDNPNIGPEDFLAGDGQNPSEYKNKKKIHKYSDDGTQR